MLNHLILRSILKPLRAYPKAPFELENDAFEGF